MFILKLLLWCAQRRTLRLCGHILKFISVSVSFYYLKLKEPAASFTSCCFAVPISKQCQNAVLLFSCASSWQHVKYDSSRVWLTCSTSCLEVTVLTDSLQTDCSTGFIDHCIWSILPAFMSVVQYLLSIPAAAVLLQHSRPSGEVVC